MFWNRLPGLESSKQNKAQEDLFYDKMMCGLLQIVLRPLLDEKVAAALASSPPPPSLPLPLPPGATATTNSSGVVHKSDVMDIDSGSVSSGASVTSRIRDLITGSEQCDDYIHVPDWISMGLPRCAHTSDGWIAVRSTTTTNVPTDPMVEMKNDTWVNTLKWKAVTRKHRHKVLSSFFI